MSKEIGNCISNIIENGLEKADSDNSKAITLRLGNDIVEYWICLKSNSNGWLFSKVIKIDELLISISDILKSYDSFLGF